MDLDRLEAGAEKWQMRFNTDKCKVMGRNNASHPYILNGKTLGNTDMEKDLGIFNKQQTKLQKPVSDSCRQGQQDNGLHQKGQRRP